MRYPRQQILKEIRKSGQERLKKSSVAVVGLGALGSVSAEHIIFEPTRERHTEKELEIEVEF